MCFRTTRFALELELYESCGSLCCCEEPPEKPLLVVEDGVVDVSIVV